MIVYEGPYLSVKIDKQNKRFIQNWTSPLKSVEDFKSEMLEYTSLYKEYKLPQTLWIQENFTLILEPADFLWIEEKVNIPCFGYGNKKAAFVVGKDVLAHLTVIESFEKTKSVINVQHFATEKEALSWLNDNSKKEAINLKPKISFEGVDNEGNFVMLIKHSTSNITHTIKSFKDLIEENNFIKANIKSYSSLTNREKEILTLYAKGLQAKEVANEIFISVHTVQTHWRNIKQKLAITCFLDIIKFVKAFDLL